MPPTFGSVVAAGKTHPQTAQKEPSWRCPSTPSRPSPPRRVPTSPPSCRQRLDALNDLALTLKHIHWNVVGPHFIAVHEMLDPQVDAVRLMVDAIAERIATLGVAPVGTPGALVKNRTWEDYSIGRDSAIAHLGALDVVYIGVIEDHRKAAKDVEEIDDVTNDLLIGHLHELELFHWFVRAHLESAGGVLTTGNAQTEKTAARKASREGQRVTRIPQRPARRRLVRRRAGAPYGPPGGPPPLANPARPSRARTSPPGSRTGSTGRSRTGCAAAAGPCGSSRTPGYGAPGWVRVLARTLLAAPAGPRRRPARRGRQRAGRRAVGHRRCAAGAASRRRRSPVPSSRSQVGDRTHRVVTDRGGLRRRDPRVRPGAGLARRRG